LVKIITLENGSKIEILESKSDNIRGNRSNIISFWCDNCNMVHESVHISEMMCLDDNRVICRTSFNGVRDIIGNWK